MRVSHRERGITEDKAICLPWLESIVVYRCFLNEQNASIQWCALSLNQVLPFALMGKVLAEQADTAPVMKPVGNLEIQSGGQSLDLLADDIKPRKVTIDIESVHKAIAYTYDSQDRRIAKFVDGALVERYGHDGTDLAVVINPAGQVSQRYLYGVDEVLSETTASGMVWSLADRLGSVDLIVDDQGGVVDRVTFDSFGNKTYESKPEKAFRFGFTGREADPETGLYYYRARYYDPAVGRFISVDPIGYQAGDTNLYRYVFNSPTMGIDPTGQSWKDLWNGASQFVQNTWNSFSQNAYSTGLKAAEMTASTAINIGNTVNAIANAPQVATDYWAKTVVDGQKEGGIIGFGKQLLGTALGTLSSVGTEETIGKIAMMAAPATGTVAGATANIAVKIGSAIHEDWKEAGRDTTNIFEHLLFAADKVIAGFANVVSLGWTNKVREEQNGAWIKAQHQGALYNTGQVLGVGATIALAFVTPNTLVGSIGLAGRAAQGYTLGTAGYAAYETTTKIIEGKIDWKNPLSYLEIAASYAPVIGVVGKSILGASAIKKSVTATSEFFASKGKIVENAVDSLVSRTQAIVTDTWNTFGRAKTAIVDLSEAAINKATTAASNVWEGLNSVKSGIIRFGENTISKLTSPFDDIAIARNIGKDIIVMDNHTSQVGSYINKQSIINERFNSSVIKQKSSTMCGSACGEMLLKEQGLSVTQEDVLKLAGTMLHDFTAPTPLAKALNKISPSTTSSWVGGTANLSKENLLSILNNPDRIKEMGSWAATIERGEHFVVVKGYDKHGNIRIYDPWGKSRAFDSTEKAGVSYSMSVENFLEAWDGQFVFKQGH